MNETINTFGYPQTLIKEYQFWIVMLRPEQVTVGSLVIAAKSEARHLGELSSEEWAEFSVVTAEVENLLTKCFGAEKFNYLALMMKDPNVHFHFVPRYSKPVNVDGEEYVDNDWPYKTELKSIQVTEDIFSKIQSELKKNLS